MKRDYATFSCTSSFCRSWQLPLRAIGLTIDPIASRYIGDGDVALGISGLVRFGSSATVVRFPAESVSTEDDRLCEVFRVHSHMSTTDDLHDSDDGQAWINRSWWLFAEVVRCFVATGVSAPIRSARRIFRLAPAVTSASAAASVVGNLVGDYNWIAERLDVPNRSTTPVRAWKISESFVSVFLSTGPWIDLSTGLLGDYVSVSCRSYGERERGLIKEIEDWMGKEGHMSIFAAAPGDPCEPPEERF